MTGSRRCFKLVNCGVDAVLMQHTGEGEAAKTRADNSNVLFQQSVSFLSITIYRYLVKPEFSLPCVNLLMDMREGLDMISIAGANLQRGDGRNPVRRGWPRRRAPTLYRWQDVGVGVEGHCDLAVPQQLLDDLGMNPNREQLAVYCLKPPGNRL